MPVLGIDQFECIGPTDKERSIIMLKGIVLKGLYSQDCRRISIKMPLPVHIF